MAQPPTNEAIVRLLEEMQAQIAALARDVAELRGATVKPAGVAFIVSIAARTRRATRRASPPRTSCSTRRRE